MWTVEIAYKYTNIVSRHMYNTEEDAKAARDLIAPHIGKDRFINDKTSSIRITDLYGTNDIVCDNVVTIRLLDVDGWNEMVENEKAMQDKRKKEAKEFSGE